MTSKPKTADKNSGGSSRKVPILAIVFVLVAGLLIAAMFLGGSNTVSAAEQYGTPEITGSPLPRFPDPPPASVTADPAYGLIAPEVVGQDFENNTVAISHDGTPKAIVFLAHWCPHCQAEVPRVTDWINETGGVEGVEILSVATSIDNRRVNFPPSGWLADEDWPVPVIRDDETNSVLISYGAGGFPYWVFLNGDGSVAGRSAGQLDIDTLEFFLTQLADTN